jgi:DNA (cytosine-5)-methyltransferase 1
VPETKVLKFIDLFAGVGAFRLGFERACKDLNLKADCVFTSEIKRHAIDVYKANFPKSYIDGDITQIDASSIPEFDVLLAGFPCQAFSSAGKRQGFVDTRGTLFFDIQRIIEHHQPKIVLLENVEGLVTHDRQDRKSPIGQTLQVILEILESLGYQVTWKVLDATNFGLAQARKRIYIVAHREQAISLDPPKTLIKNLAKILEKDLPVVENKTTKLILKNYEITELHGKSLKDKRGGSENIHSWDIGLKGKVSREQKLLLSKMLKARRYKKFAESKGIQWMDGMPLTVEEIRTFHDVPKLAEMLSDLEAKGYVTYEHPKDLAPKIVNDKAVLVREPRLDLEKGYNIVVGKLSFEINKILDPKGFAPTLVATDLGRLFVVDGEGLRPLSLTEKLRLFGLPDNFKMPVTPKEQDDLLGNTVAVNVIEFVAKNALLNVPNLDEPKVQNQLFLDI